MSSGNPRSDMRTGADADRSEAQSIRRDGRGPRRFHAPRKALVLAAVLLIGMGTYRYLATMPVGTGETRISPDGRFTASVTDFTQSSFLTGERRRWLRYRIEGQGFSHEIETPPLPGPGPGSREIPPVIRWDADSATVEFVLPSRRLRLGTQPFTP